MLQPAVKECESECQCESENPEAVGIADPNCKKAIFTTNSKGELFLDIEERKTGRKLSLTGSLKRGKIRKLDQDLWVMGNTLFPGLAHPELVKAICFPFAQHYIADSPGIFTKVKDIEDLIGKYNEFAKYESYKTFSARTIVNQILFGVAFIAFVIALFVLIF
ncbi:MAG: hypothetical protein MUC78_04145 [Bacteroidales bacterium]|jgi:hypothetical protein|nr:hypothetical protein [Bacteroidales bacterium]